MNLINTLIKSLLIDKEELEKFSASAPYRYKVYAIPKRNSNEKRIIAHPAKELKLIQRELVKILSEILPIHDSVYSYRIGRGIKENAQKHLYSKYLLKIDFKSFFPSITPDIFFLQLEKNNINLSLHEKLIIEKLLFWKPDRKSSSLELSIGAPSSPLISNFIMYEFDKKVFEFCKKINVSYTRYADDITFSTNCKGVLFSIPDEIDAILLTEYLGKITLNKKKTIFSSKANNRHVTGVRLSNNDKLSIGREKKRVISSKVHKFLLGHFDDDMKQKLQGELSFCFYLEPSFKDMLVRKYGNKFFTLYR